MTQLFLYAFIGIVALACGIILIEPLIKNKKKSPLRRLLAPFTLSYYLGMAISLLVIFLISENISFGLGDYDYKWPLLAGAIGLLVLTLALLITKKHYSIPKYLLFALAGAIIFFMSIFAIGVITNTESMSFIEQAVLLIFYLYIFFKIITGFISIAFMPLLEANGFTLIENREYPFHELAICIILGFLASLVLILIGADPANTFMLTLTILGFYGWVNRVFGKFIV